MKTEDWKKRKDLAEKNAAKYKKVRFTEKTKLQRKIRQLREKLVSLIEANQSVDETESELNRLLDDLQYVLRFPLDEKYISLFPKDPLSQAALTRQAEVREKINTRNVRRSDLEERQSKALGLSKSTDSFFLETTKRPNRPINTTATSNTSNKTTTTTIKPNKPNKPTTTSNKPFSKPNIIKPVISKPTTTPTSKPTSKPTTSSEPRKTKTMTKPEPASHPSWTAKADPRLRGTLVSGSTNNRLTFDDSD